MKYDDDVYLDCKGDWWGQRCQLHSYVSQIPSHFPKQESRSVAIMELMFKMHFPVKGLIL